MRRMTQKLFNGLSAGVHNSKQWNQTDHLLARNNFSRFIAIYERFDDLSGNSLFWRHGERPIFRKLLKRWGFPPLKEAAKVVRKYNEFAVSPRPTSRTGDS